MKRSILILGHDYNFWWRTQLKGGDELDLCQSPFESFFKEFMNLLFRSLKSGSNFSFRKVLSSPISYCLFPFEWLFVSKSSFWIQLSINNCWQINQIKIAIIVSFTYMDLSYLRLLENLVATWGDYCQNMKRSCRFQVRGFWRYY